MVKTAYAVESKSLLLTGSEARVCVQRIKNPSNPNADLRGIGVLSDPAKTTFFYMAGAIILVQILANCRAMYN